MSIEAVREYLRGFGREQDIQEFDVSSATVELAAQALHTAPAHIAKTLSFEGEDGCILVVAAGDAKVDNQKFKATFDRKAKMLTPDQVTELTGHAVGGVCPFAVPASARVYADVSLKRVATVFPACGSSNSAIGLTCEDLAEYARILDWVDVCKNWDPALTD